MTWATLSALDGYHGINPGMGWLFAVDLGMQEHRRAAVWWTLLPLAVSHAAAVAVALLVAAAAGVFLPLITLKLIVAALLVAFGSYKLMRSRHPRYGGMQMSLHELAIWSFLMASAHGAGLMVVPVLLGIQSPSPAMVQVAASPLAGLAAAAVHTAGYLLVTGVIAVVVYERLGVFFLRRAWINLDLTWAAALILTGLVTLMI